MKSKEGHRFDRKVYHWPYCSRCGLVALKNDTTARAMQLGCEWHDIIYPRKSLGGKK